MKRYLLCCLFLFGCVSSKMMNTDVYCNVSMGMSEKELICIAGKPYSICKNPDGSCVYEYIERIGGYNRQIMQINYYIRLKNGKVVYKRSEKSYPPIYQYEALDYESKNDL